MNKIKQIPLKMIYIKNNLTLSSDERVNVYASHALIV